MSPRNEESRPGGGGNSSSNSSNLNGATRGRQTPALHAVTKPIVVVAGSGRSRVLLPYRCPSCDQHHLSHWHGELPPMAKRSAACGAGPVVLHVAAQEVAA